MFFFKYFGSDFEGFGGDCCFSPQCVWTLWFWLKMCGEKKEGRRDTAVLYYMHIKLFVVRSISGNLVFKWIQFKYFLVLYSLVK